MSRPNTHDRPNGSPAANDSEQGYVEDSEEKTEEPIGLELATEDEKDLDRNFSDFDLDPQLSETIAKVGWEKPTPVQALCLPQTLAGRDVAGFAQTGTGKTGVFLITVAQKFLAQRRSAEGSKKGPFAVILAPTRELAMQIQADAEPILGELGISSIAVFGGVDYEKQASAIRSGVDVIVATPGRLKDFYQKKAFNFSNCEIFVCDEADRMFDMGFIEDVEYFFAALAETSQKLLFSATTNEKVKELAFEYLEKPRYISVNPESLTPENIEQHAVICRSDYKLRVLMGLMEDHKPTCAVIFTNTKLVAEWLHFKLSSNNIEVDLITGDLPQGKRINLIKRIKNGEIKALVATDVASRGLHITDLSHVYNFDLPDEAANYVHRIGRTARAGARGCSYSLVCEDYGQNLTEINELLGAELSLKSEWYDERYLKIEDKAGEFISRGRAPSNSRAGGGRDNRDNRGGRAHGKPEGARVGGGNRNSASRGPRGDNRHHHGSDKDSQQHQSGDRNKGRNRRRPRGKARDDQRSPSVAAAAAAPTGHDVTSPPKSTGGIIKRFFGALFGSRGN